MLLQDIILIDGMRCIKKINDSNNRLNIDSRRIIDNRQAEKY